MMMCGVKKITISMIDPTTMCPAKMTLTLASIPEDHAAGSPHSEAKLARWLEQLQLAAPHLADGSRDVSVTPLYRVGAVERV